jgi:uncharacterized protein (DUF2249 family)
MTPSDHSPPLSADVPPALRAHAVRAAVVLDVRPILARGGDPFQHIMATLAQLEDDVALHLIVGFEPTPLYAVMRGRGRAALVDKQGDAVHVWFYRDAVLSSGAAAEPQRAPLLPPVSMDVRGLAPPAPMVAILERLTELGEGAQLIVRHHREPTLLYDKLTARGYAARTERRGEGDYVIHIAPAWALGRSG